MCGVPRTRRMHLCRESRTEARLTCHNVPNHVANKHPAVLALSFPTNSPRMFRSAWKTASKQSLHLARQSSRRFHPLATSWNAPSASLVPIVIEQTVSANSSFRAQDPSYLASHTQGRGERSYDIFSRLLRERVIMLYGPVRLIHLDAREQMSTIEWNP